jgi:hypothetical protein
VTRDTQYPVRSYGAPALPVGGGPGGAAGAPPRPCANRCDATAITIAKTIQTRERLAPSARRRITGAGSTSIWDKFFNPFSRHPRTELRATRNYTTEYRHVSLNCPVHPAMSPNCKVLLAAMGVCTDACATFNLAIDGDVSTANHKRMPPQRLCTGPLNFSDGRRIAPCGGAVPPQPLQKFTCTILTRACFRSNMTRPSVSLMGYEEASSVCIQT